MSLFDLIFTTRIPENMRYRSFTAGHALLLLTVAAGIVLAAFFVKKCEISRRERLVLYSAWAVPCVYLFRFTVFLLLDLFVEPQMPFLDRLPFHLCALNAVIMPLGVTTRNNTLLNYMYAIAMPGAAAAMLTPAMSYYGGYSYYSFQIIFFFLDHGLMALVPVLCIVSGILRPSVKAAPRVMAFFLLYCAAIYPVNVLLNQNYLFLNYPDEGTVMAFFAARLGNPGYLFPMAVLAFFIVICMYLPWLVKGSKSA